MFERKQLQKQLFSYLLRIAVAVLMGVIIIHIASGQITKISTSLAEKKRLSLLLQRKSETTRQLAQDLAVVGDNDKKILAALPPAQNILDFIGVLDNLAAKNSIKQTTKFNTPVPVSPEGGEGISIQKIDYSISLSGNVFTLMSYLKDFENLPYFTKINSFNIQGGSSLGWEGESTISIQAIVYVQGGQE